MKKDSKIRLVKIQGDKDSHYPIGYWSEGILLADVERGHTIKMLRYLRSGREQGEPSEVKVTGYFTSSIVTHIEGTDVITANSIWKVVEVK
jgi:hypothetical protein